MNKYVVALAFSGFALGLSQTALADALPSNPDCDSMGGNVGANCVVGGNAGTCTSTTCAHITYIPDGDGGYDHGTEQVHCIVCVENGSAPSAADGGPPEDGGGASNLPPSSEEDSSCSMSAHGTAKLAVPWLLALGVSLAFRKKRR